MPSISPLTSRRLVIVGLGNYTHPLTKHSVGQVLLKSLASHAASLPGSTGSPHLLLQKHARTSAWTTQITLPPPSTRPDLGHLEILFVLPKQLMNVCGQSIVNSFTNFLPLSPPSSPSTEPNQKSRSIPKLLILVDNLDLAPSSTTLQKSGGSKGHNGLRSLISSLGGSREFWRFWIGIGRPEGKERGEGVSQWVLGPLGREEVRACEEGGRVLREAWKVVEKVGWEE